jgi:hypothetical protein
MYPATATIFPLKFILYACSTCFRYSTAAAPGFPQQPTFSTLCVSDWHTPSWPGDLAALALGVAGGSIIVAGLLRVSFARMRADAWRSR